jgi:hypothetical protein
MGLDMYLRARTADSEEEVGYWRKANHIHYWFVKNVQNGTDDCGTYPVSREQLETLLATCRRVLDFKHLAEGQLPRRSGFFYGNVFYDEYYYEDIRQTIEILEKCIRHYQHAQIEYQSSW